MRWSSKHLPSSLLRLQDLLVEAPHRFDTAIKLVERYAADGKPEAEQHPDDPPDVYRIREAFGDHQGFGEIQVKIRRVKKRGHVVVLDYLFMEELAPGFRTDED